jgi:hypothetical protein
MIKGKRKSDFFQTVFMLPDSIHVPTPDTSTLVWYIGHAVLLAWFSAFISPLRHADKANVTYFWAISFTTLLLFVSTVSHAPRLFHSRSTQMADVLAFTWAVFPFCFVCLQVLSNISRRVIGYTITSPLRSLLSNSLLITLAIGLQYTTCLDRNMFSGAQSPGWDSLTNFAALHCSLIESPLLIALPILLTSISLLLLSELVGTLLGSSFKFFQSRHRRHGAASGEHAKPVQIPMVPWFSLSLTTTAIQVLVSLKVFVGRLDIRHILNAVCKEESDVVFDMRSQDPWIDFLADGGEGFNSSYTIARLLAQPNINVQVPRELRTQKLFPGLSVGSSAIDSPAEETDRKSQKSSTPREDIPSASSLSSQVQRRMVRTIESAQDIRIYPTRSDIISLLRASVVVHGGDLAYPRPSSDTYRQRFVAPLEQALPAGPGGGSRPRMFLIPGNHDHYDGLESFVRFIIGRASLGGWKLPQKSSYFALQLPKGWWILGLDIGITNDVDVFQYGTFCKIIDERVKEDDRVVVVSHRPQWVSDHYNGVYTGELFHQLLDRVGNARLALRLAGDLHHYQRYQGGPWAPALVTSGGGGAFLHPTHVPEEASINEYFAQIGRHRIEGVESDSEDEVGGSVDLSDEDRPISPIKYGKKSLPVKRNRPDAKYTRSVSYPPEEMSKKLALMNLVGFRDKNWGADIVFGSMYFLMGVSVLPICSSAIVVGEFRKGFSFGLVSFLCDAVLPALKAVYLDSVVSLLAHLVFFAACFAGAKSHNNKFAQKIMMAGSHFFSHAVASITLFCLVEVAIEFFSQLAGGRDSIISDGFRVPGIVTAMDKALFSGPVIQHGLEWLLRFVDFPSSLIRNRQPLCSMDPTFVTRDLVFRYLWRLFPFFWIIATPVAAQIMGTYLFLSVNWLGCHMNEAFSSLRIEDYKHFIRMFIDPVTENLHVYVVGVDTVPKHWEEDPAWDVNLFKAAGQPLPPSARWVSPSRWRPTGNNYSDPTLVDYFVIPKNAPAMERTKTAHW